MFTDNTEAHTRVYGNALDSGWFEVVYEDKECAVLHIRDQKAEPPPDENDTDDSGKADKGNNNRPPE